MKLWIKLAADNKTILSIRDISPPYGESNWREDIEVRPSIVQYEQGYGKYNVTLDVTPAQIIWPIINFDAVTVKKNKAAALIAPNPPV